MAMVVENQVQQVQNLTDQITEVLEYMAGLQKTYTDKTIDNKISDYSADLGKTKDELQALVKSLDGLDFKEDGKIDPKVITAKVAQNEADMKVARESLADVKSKLTDMEAAIKNGGNVDLTDVDAKIKAVKDEVEAVKAKVQGFDGKFADQQKQLDALKLDVEKLKANLKNTII